MAAMKFSLLMLVFSMAVVVLVGAKSSPAPVDCTSVVLSMSDCLSYVTNGSTVDKPEGNCCNGLKTVLKTSSECLCEGFKSSSQFGVVLNVSKALGLPKACKVNVDPSTTTCGLSVAPTGAPSPAGGVVAPAGAPSGFSIANTPAMSPEGNVVSPSMSPTNTGAATATGVSMQMQLIVVGLAAVFFSSF
ncbi:hypothetical protein SOVF_155650 [Spinacia oleracea]|uniref:Non-specific lipid transfer protein GPI-anchored 31 n=1 Tax=Spinacia oleracea TaxID=3562 RepID=A0A9R0JXA8_SPIOL|nr:non-specific lipid transfer protein GPI-anchored 31-like [Spinacia oleracea]KNA09214.1 hypothetical protein SOVF_155650 [Spinacia oleracea]